jgi:hypothetical protein
MKGTELGNNSDWHASLTEAPPEPSGPFASYKSFIETNKDNQQLVSDLKPLTELVENNENQSVKDFPGIIEMMRHVFQAVSVRNLPSSDFDTFDFIFRSFEMAYEAESHAQQAAKASELQNAIRKLNESYSAMKPVVPPITINDRIANLTFGYTPDGKNQVSETKRAAMQDIGKSLLAGKAISDAKFSNRQLVLQLSDGREIETSEPKIRNGDFLRPLLEVESADYRRTISEVAASHAAIPPTNVDVLHISYQDIVRNLIKETHQAIAEAAKVTPISYPDNATLGTLIPSGSHLKNTGKASLIDM